MRTDIRRDAMKEIGYTHGGLRNTPETFFDGLKFDPTNSVTVAPISTVVKAIAAARASC